MLNRKELLEYAIEVKEKSFPFPEREDHDEASVYSSLSLKTLGRFLKEVGEKSNDYEVLGIGQSMLDHADKLDKPWSNPF